MAGDDAKARLRAQIRRDRRGSDTGASGLAENLESAWHGASVAGYIPLPGEPDISPALEAVAARGGEVWLPVTIVDEPLRWARWQPSDFLLASPGSATPLARLLGPRMRAHRDAGEVQSLARGHRILESGDLAAQVSLVLAPALAVDEAGVRLGQGGGYFDRSFGPAGVAGGSEVPIWACVNAREVLPVGSLPTEPHDLRVDAALTPDGWRPLRPAR